VLDLPSWSWINVVQQGPIAPARMGHSSICIGKDIWFFGGGHGRDLCRDGHDLTDVYILDYTHNNLVVWKNQPISSPDNFQLSSFPSLGRCHCSVKVGNKMIFFAGSISYSNAICVLDLETKQLSVPKVSGRLPIKRMSPKCIFKDGKIWIWGGFSCFRQNMGDLWWLQSISSDQYEDATDPLSSDEDGEDENERILCPVQ